MIFIIFYIKIIFILIFIIKMFIIVILKVLAFKVRKSCIFFILLINIIKDNITLKSFLKNHIKTL